MRLPDDYEDHGSGLTPTVVSAIVAVTIFVVVILTVVLIINRKPASHQQNNTTAQTENVQQAGNQQTAKYPDTQDLITGSTLTPSDLDFWDMYRRQRLHRCLQRILPDRMGKKIRRIQILPPMESIPW